MKYKNKYGSIISKIFRKIEVKIIFLLIITGVIYSDTKINYVKLIKDQVYYHVLSEGLIVVDTPQLFTRERLVNERLRESEWIDEQIDLVSEKLKKQEFANVNSVAIVQNLAHMRLGRIGTGEERKVGYGASVDDRVHSSPQKLLEYLEGTGAFHPSPSAAFEAAQNYRERLSHKRYEAILDDAHDIGENTLHRLNFRLTIHPARHDSSSLVGVNVVMSEATDRGQLMESYSKLIFDLNKRLESIIQSLTVDKMLIFNSSVSDYSLTPKEEIMLDEIIIDYLMNYDDSSSESKLYVQEALRKIVDLSRELSREYVKKQLRRQLVGRVSEKFSAVFFEQDSPIGWEADGGSADWFSHVYELCKRRSPIALPDLLTSETSRRLEEYRKEIDEEYNSKKKNMNMHDKEDKREFIISKEYVERRSFREFSRSVFNLQCPGPQNDMVVAKLRLIGILHHLVETTKGIKIDPKCAPELVSSVLQSSAAVAADTKQAAAVGTEGGCKALEGAASRIGERIWASGAEIGATGLTRLIDHSLKNKKMEKTNRVSTLEKFFDFDYDSCTVENCVLRIRNKSEDPNFEASDRYMVGVQEAMRLFLELSCFADARSYTVWPRSDLRDAAVKALQDAKLAQFDVRHRGLGAGAEGEVSAVRGLASRRDENFVFGISDWGMSVAGQESQRGDNGGEVRPCDPQSMRLLDDFDSDDNFEEWMEKKIKQSDKNAVDDENNNESSDPKFGIWWDSVLNSCAKHGISGCEKGNLLSLAELAIKLRKTETRVAWLVAPRPTGSGSGVGHVPLSLPLSAIISVPSWWSGLKIEVHTCWLRPSEVSRIGRLQESPCLNDGRATMRRIDLPLPGHAQDILQKLGFFILKTPYLDVTERDSEMVEAGREARVRLIGGRLWKNPRVRLGAQWQDRVEVLPDMQGLIAVFNCVEPSTDWRKQIVRFDSGKLMAFGKRTERAEVPVRQSQNDSCLTAGGGGAAKPVENGAGQNKEVGVSEEQGNGKTGQGEQGSSMKPDHKCVPGMKGTLTASVADFQSGGQKDLPPPIPEETLYEDRAVQVWTSEGVTGPHSVRVLAFRPRFLIDGNPELPCWSMRHSSVKNGDQDR